MVMQQAGNGMSLVEIGIALLWVLNLSKDQISVETPRNLFNVIGEVRIRTLSRTFTEQSSAASEQLCTESEPIDLKEDKSEAHQGDGDTKRRRCIRKQAVGA